MSDSPKFGIRPVGWLASGASIDDKVDWVVRAEEMGFDSVHVGDRLLAKAPPAYGSTNYEVTTLLNVLAANTETVELGTLVFVVPFRHPIHIAKVFGSMDIASNDRIILGVGTGWNPHEFKSLGIPREKRGLLLEEGVEVVKKLWTEDHVDYDGRYYDLENVTVEPKPRRDPPIWFGSFGPQVEEFSAIVDRVLERIGRLGDGWAPLTYSAVGKEMTSADQLGKAWEKIEQAAIDNGRDPDDIEIVYSHWSYVMEDEGAERADCKDALDAWFDGTYEEGKDTYLIGTADEVADTIAERTAQLPRVDRYVFTPFNYDDAQMDRIAEDVRPLLE